MNEFLNKEGLSTLWTKIKSLVNSNVETLTNKDTEIETEVAKKANISDLNAYAKKTDIPSHDNFATKDELQEVSTKIDNIAVISDEYINGLS